MKPGEELHKCQLVTLPTDSEIEVVAFSHKYTAGSHHFLVFATALDTIPVDLQGQYDCVNGDEPIMDHSRGILYGAQSPEATFPLPAQVGFKMKARQVLMLQAHYINPTSAPISISGYGDRACGDVLSCVQSCPGSDAPRFTSGGVLVGPCWQRCVAKGCEGAVDGVLPVSFCVAEKCAAECSAGPDSCATCATTKCITEVGACLAHQCSDRP